MQYSNLIWRNEQPYSEMFDDIYYSSNQDEYISGENEFNHVFFKHNGLPERWCDRDQFVIAELGLGSGLNCLLTIRAWLKHCEASGDNKTLHYIAIEKYPLSPQAIVELISRYPELRPLCDEFIENYPPAVATTHTRHLFDNRVVVHFKFLDAHDALKSENLKVDAWYLDGFSPAKNAAMWSPELFEKLAKNSRDGATFSTYTAAGFVKRNLQAAGFEVCKVSGYGRKRDMLKGVFAGNQEIPLRYIDKPWFNPCTDLAAIKTKVEKKHISVLGAGIAGLSVAYAMVKRGWTVTIIDKHEDVAKETSGNPSAIVYPRLSINSDVDMAFYTAAYCHSVYTLNALQKKSAEKFWFDSGLVQQIEKERLIDIIEKNEFNDEYISLIEKTELDMGAVAPVMEGKKNVFARYKSAGVVLPSVLCAVLKELCADSLTMIHCEIDKVTARNNKWLCLAGDKLVSESDVLVVANGAGLNSIGLSSKFPVENVRGQVAVVDVNAKSKDISETINASVHVTPPISNKHYVGATYSRDNTSVDIDADETRELLQSINKVLPDTFDGADFLAAWAGFRTVSNDRVPIVGAMPDELFFKEEYVDICHGKVNRSYKSARYLEGLYLSAAHGSRGFTTSFLSAEIIAAQINDEPMPVGKDVLDYLSPARFVVNDLKRG